MHRTTILALMLVPAASLGCDRSGDDGSAAKSASASPSGAAPSSSTKSDAPAKAAPAAKAAAPAEAEPAAPAELVLETAELPGLGTLKMPKGWKSTAEKHWTYDLGNYESINVSWEPHGAADLKKAQSMSNILATAETVKSAKTLDNGYHEIERVRASDGFTFIALFGKDWYIKCVAPAAKIEVCREIVRSKA